jgi:hypothetical protein
MGVGHLFFIFQSENDRLMPWTLLSSRSEYLFSIFSLVIGGVPAY